MNNLNAIISSLIPVAAASGATSYFTSVQNKVVSFLNSCLPFVWIIVALALIGVGLMCIIGSERSKEAAKSKAVYVVIGCGVVLGAMYLAKGVADLLTMGDHQLQSRKYILKFDVSFIIMKNKKLVSKIGAIALCAVMAAGSVVSINAAVVDDSEVGSLGYGRKVISLDSTGQTILQKRI